MARRLLIAVVLLATTSCGRGNDESASDRSSNETVAWVGSVVSGDRTATGWPVPVGTWATDAFGPPLVFDTDTDLMLVAEDDQLVYLATPGGQNLIMIARTSGIWNGSADVPVPESADDMAEALAANPAHTIQTSGELEGVGPVPWWDIVIEEQADFVYPCWLDLNCAFSTFGGDSKVHALQGEPFRIYSRNDLQIGLGVHVSGKPQGLDDALAIADGIAASLRPAPEDLPALPAARFLGLRTERGMPAGSILAPAGSRALQFDLAQARPEIGWISHLGGLEFLAGDDVLIVAEPILVDPEVPPTFCPPSPARPPVGRPAFVSDHTNSAADFEAYLEAFVDIEDSGETELLGEKATWWQLGDPLPEATVSCPGPNGMTDVAFFLAVQEGGLAQSTDDGTSTRVHRLDESGLMVAVRTPERSDDPLASFGDLLDAATVVPSL